MAQFRENPWAHSGVHPEGTPRGTSYDTIWAHPGHTLKVHLPAHPGHPWQSSGPLVVFLRHRSNWHLPGAQIQ